MSFYLGHLEGRADKIEANAEQIKKLLEQIIAELKKQTSIEINN